MEPDNIIGDPRNQTLAAARMRRLRDRRRRGYRCAVVEIGSRDVSVLVDRGYLNPKFANDMTAVEAAIGVLLDGLPVGYR